MLSSKRTKIRLSSCQPSFLLSAEILANNEDLLAEILLRLPIKSLLKFKCVSKNWLSLISNPRFSHRRNDNSPCCGLFLVECGSPYAEYQFVALDSSHSKAPFKHLTFVNDPSEIELIQSCNGLLLCRSFRPSGPDRTYYVYNPTTKQYTILPRLRRVLGAALAFDPSNSPHYKVICVRKRRSLQHHYQIEIYSSNNGPWRVSGTPFTAEDQMVFKSGVFCNGVIHWLNVSGGTLLCFDVDGEQLKETPMPPAPQIDDGLEQRQVWYFGESQGRLHLVELPPQATTQLDVHEMRADCSGWFVKCRIDLDAIAGAFPEMIMSSSPNFWEVTSYAFEILVFVRGEREENSFSVLLHIPGKVIRYDFKDKSSTTLCDFNPTVEGLDFGPENESNFVMFDVYQYIESLSCV
ncbi:unnamed protein product [Dovyalis caffra]|uniref:F-box domain-containing protein n=1 Tax=Dovyalis caffra TaxID=77055 RepID=A0AAV1ST76_9ROSI|nr:unnamed protein product [Dovyalis caffra]